MRFELAGSLSHLAPLVIRYDANANFSPPTYTAQGYVYFDVICIGGGGGMGGGIDTGNLGTLIRSYGGAGGGGGLHRVQGLLSALPAACPVIVGAGGILGTEDISDPNLTTDGGDGGYSSFNVTTCFASGGKGGLKVLSNSPTVGTGADGGAGGIGGRTLAGGGAAGGTAGIPADPGPGTAGTAGSNGEWDGVIGSGAGGGAGGVGKYGSGGNTLNLATAGGGGSYNMGDLSVYAPGGSPSADLLPGSATIMPGYAGGAKASPVNGLPYVFGSSKGLRLNSDPGVVIIRLTAE